MTTIKPGEKIDKQTAVKELWKKGVLYWKLNSAQKQMYDSFYNTKGKTCVFTSSRRFGKSTTLLLIALEFGLKNPESTIKFVFPEKKMAKSVIRPIMRMLTKDCPKELMPEYSTQDEAWILKNGSEIQLAGADLGGADSLRGSNAALSIIDEAGFCDDLDYIVQSILLPSMATTGGKLLMASTPPVSTDHPFVQYALRSQTHRTFTIWDNVMIPEEEKLMLRDEAGGEDSPSWKREYLCLDGDVDIKTKTGYKPIKDIIPGEFVFTHKGNYQKVLHTFRNATNNRDVYEINCSNHFKTKVTKGHELQIATSKYKHLKNGYTVDWKHVEDIDLSSETKRIYFAVPIDKNISPCNYSEELAFLIGWHIAEGHTGKNFSVLSLNYKDPFDEINRCSQIVWGKQYKIYTKNDGCFQANLNSKIAKQFYDQFGRGARNKFIPYELKTAPDNIKIALLKALSMGDGHCNYKRCDASFNSISKQLALDISDMLLSLGIANSIARTTKGGNSVILGRQVKIQDCFAVRIYGSNFNDFVKKIYNVNNLAPRRNSIHYIQDGYFFSRITKIEKIPYDKPYVYDLEVENDHSYVGAHTVFHNCIMVSDANRTVVPEFVDVKKKIVFKEYKRPQFFHTYEALDFGWARDNSVILFAYYDFDNQKLIIEDEWLALGTEATSEKMAEHIKKKEQELWIDTLTGEVNAPKKRVADTDYRVLFDLSSKHQISVIPTAKYDKDSALSDVRTKIRNEKILISEKCVNLIKQLEHGIWNKNRTSYQRSEALGHLDAIDALIYLVRNVDWNANPYPKGFGIGSRENTFIPSNFYESKSPAAKWLKGVFKVKSSFGDGENNY